MVVEGIAVAGVVVRVFAVPLLFVDDDSGAIQVQAANEQSG